MTGGVLYISYNGILEPLGESQVLAYQEKLAGEHPVHLVSFERARDWRDAGRREEMSERMRRAGIFWYPLRYHQRLSVVSTLWDITRGMLLGGYLVRRKGLEVVHARSYVPSVMALAIKRATGVRFLFDMRGFWVDERVDGGLWPRDGRMFRIGKAFERRFLRAADHVVSLTHAAVTVMRGFTYLQSSLPPMTVIPTCADLDRFRPPADGPVREGFTLGYVGSAGTWYEFDAAVTTYRLLLLLRPEARFLIINRDGHGYIRDRLAAAGVDMERVELRSASPAEVPAQIARMDAAVFFIKPLFSKQASAPTKLGEILGCGVPCLSNAGVGDMAGVLESDDVGVAVSDFSEASLQEGIHRLLALLGDAETPDRCVAAAHRHFSLDEGVRRYRQVYLELGVRSA